MASPHTRLKCPHTRLLRLIQTPAVSRQNIVSTISPKKAPITSSHNTVTGYAFKIRFSICNETFVANCLVHFWSLWFHRKSPGSFSSIWHTDITEPDQSVMPVTISPHIAALPAKPGRIL